MDSTTKLELNTFDSTVDAAVLFQNYVYFTSGSDVVCNTRKIDKFAATENLLIDVIGYNTTLTEGQNKYILTIPANLNGYTIQSIHSGLSGSASSGSAVFQIRRRRGANINDILSTGVQIDAGHLTSYTSTSSSAISTTCSSVQTGDLLIFDCSASAVGATGWFAYIDAEKLT